MKQIIAVLLLLCLVTLWPGPAWSRDWPALRKGLYLRSDVGYASSRLGFSALDAPESRGGVSAGLGGGYGVNDSWLLGLSARWINAPGDPDSWHLLQVSATTAVYLLPPLFLSSQIGWGSVNSETISFGRQVSSRTKGLLWGVGTGLEFRVLRNVGVAASFRFESFDASNDPTATAVVASLEITRYFR